MAFSLGVASGSSDSPWVRRTGKVEDKSGTLTETNVDRLASLSGLMSGLETTELTAEGAAEAARISAEGAEQEALAYGNVRDIALENEKIAGIGGDISILQQQREVARTAGQASAAAGAGGVIGGGGVYDVIQSTYTQGALGAQLIGVQTTLEQGGYAEAALASEAEIAAANAQKAAADAEAKSYDEQASLAAKQTSTLQSLYRKELDQIEEIKANPDKIGGPEDDEEDPTDKSALDYRRKSGGTLRYNFGNLGA